jgi:hypothetical protein
MQCRHTSAGLVVPSLRSADGKNRQLNQQTLLALLSIQQQ